MLDLTQLRSFVAVEQMGSFTLAAERLGLGQSTVSQHIQRLESAVGRRLLARDTHKVQLTTDGEALLSHARAMLAIEAQVQSQFRGQRLRGNLRLGVSEDFVTSQLPAVLEDFVRSHPSVDLELTVALSGTLYEMQDNGEIDLVLAKRRLGDARGRLVYREPLVWLARDPEHVLSGGPLPLIAFPPPSVTRSIALEALGRSQVAWRIVCTCGSLSGLTAAARAGMGVLVQPRSMAPSGLKEIGKGRLPVLEDVEFVLVPRKGADQALVSALSDDILGKVRSLRANA
ncbi:MULTISPECIES: LysR substrate-binding domain-containing protein [unclassified Rhizobium]|uniref:LysR family transcriptional regulator n=1 Tax=unclassified Rhizobium TaxID=2613769 RepID=UPI001044CDD1|nr:MULTISPECIES: LysR substrate-binding domain-containing protein [unclassified Rhizobium]MBB3395237.1 DNA-binding transcriptional LysR family regulator [Rhizobium sp. BK060]MBB4167173.1 DNA-binding transcriptional LysR family regulator [Rhizobium sp. BK538]TCM77956.1 DNA-binding transcriptional LysR family regulator [Rhizobium sp. BK068]